MTDNKNKKNKLPSAGDTFLHKFLVETKGQDYFKNKPRGWHWFWGLHHIYNEMNDELLFDIKAIQNDIPDGHWLKKIDTADINLKRIYNANKNAGLITSIDDFLKNHELKNIIDFSELHFNDLFNDHYYFSYFIFPMDVSFAGSTFPKDISFNKAIFYGNTNFENTVFKKKADFKNAHFLDYTTFQRSTFEIHAPRFYGAKFNNEMVWTGINLPEFKQIPDEKTKQQYNNRIEDNQNAYENLATKLDNQKKYHDQHFFFREEMRCRRELGKSFIKRLPHWLYQIFADYGYGVERAFAWWLGNIIAGACIIAWIVAWVDIRYDESLSCAISASFANANPYIFFGFESSSLKACYTKLDIHIPTSFAIIRAIQSIFGVAILFLFLLTVRIRFRLK